MFHTIKSKEDKSFEELERLLEEAVRRSQEAPYDDFFDQYVNLRSLRKRIRRMKADV